MHGILTDIGIAILAATALGFLFQQLRQPVILGYLVAGALIGPGIGLKLVSSSDNIETISGIGLPLRAEGGIAQGEGESGSIALLGFHRGADRLGQLFLAQTGAQGNEKGCIMLW